VQQLRIGDGVLTASGRIAPIRWIGRRRYAAAAVAAERRVRPIRIAAGACGAGLPRRDLLVSPQHALLLRDPGAGGEARDVLVPAVQLVNGVSVTRCEALEPVAYVHIELDTHDAILAEGQPAETFVDRNSRSGFQNAAEYRALYGDEIPAIVPFCAPRIEGGAALARVRSAFDARAGLLPGRLQGHLDRADCCVVEGWAFEPDNPTGPVLVEMLVDGVVRSVVLADQYRCDLLAMNQGHCAFWFPMQALAVSADSTIVVRRVADGFQLGGPEPEQISLPPAAARSSAA
jgi:hypothetical protein